MAKVKKVRGKTKVSVKSKTKTPTKKGYRKYLQWVIPIVITIVGLELLSPLFYNVTQESSFSRSGIKSEISKLANDNILDARQAAGYMGIHVLHPYLGYVKNKETRKFANDFGMINDSPIIKKADNTVNIAITGGSVAMHFFSRRQFLEEELKKYPYFKNKKINIISLALEGYKQPQQLIALNYFTFLGAEYDMLLNIDGFNDLVLAYDENLRTRVSPFFPRSWNSYSKKAIGPEQSTRLGEMNLLKRNQVKRAVRFEKFPNNFSNFLLAYWSLVNNKDANKISELYRLYNESADGQTGKLDFQSSGPTPAYTSVDEALDDIVEKWGKASLIMNGVCKELETTYFHFLQPNQYVPNSKTFSDEENKKAYINAVPGDKSNNLDYLKGQSVVKKYDDMRNIGNRLKAEKNIIFEDLTGIFKNTSETVYKDFCCHLNDTGNRIMAASIAQRINEHLN